MEEGGREEVRKGMQRQGESKRETEREREGEVLMYLYPQMNSAKKPPAVYTESSLCIRHHLNNIFSFFFFFFFPFLFQIQFEMASLAAGLVFGSSLTRRLLREKDEVIMMRWGGKLKGKIKIKILQFGGRRMGWWLNLVTSVGRNLLRWPRQFHSSNLISSPNTLLCPPPQTHTYFILPTGSWAWQMMNNEWMSTPLVRQVKQAVC